MPGLRRIGPIVLCLAQMLCMVTVHAAAPAGSVIRNQASATYKDSNGILQNTLSNVVETIVQAVPGFELVSDQRLESSAGQTVRFNHVISNSGNETDVYPLQIENQLNGFAGVAGDIDSFNFTTMSLFADQDQNGIADNATALSQTPAIAPGDAFYFVAEVTIPAGLSNPGSASVLLSARSNLSDQLGSPMVDTNIDTVVISDAPRLQFTKSISAQTGSSPSGPYRVTLEYRNTSSASLTNITLIDQLPAGMSYLSDSGRSSALSGVVLTDFDATDSQGSGSNTIIWCAYDTGCTGLPVPTGTVSSSTSQITAIISQLLPGQFGQVWFEVEIDADMPPGVLANTAYQQFESAGSLQPQKPSNTVNFNIEGNQGVIANGSVTSSVDGMDEPVVVASIAEGGIATFNNIIWNMGNQVDTFDIEIDEASSSFPSTTLFGLFHSNGFTPLQDSNGYGIPDTGPLAVGASFRVVMRAQLPAGISGDNGGSGFSIVKRARSGLLPTLFNPVTDVLQSIGSSSVDLTNHSPLGNSTATGSGGGPESLPLHTQSTTAIGTTRLAFVLYVNNTSGLPDNYNLSVSADPDVPRVPLPANWQLVFVDPLTGGIISNTGTIAPGASKRIHAEVTVPARAVADLYSLYFSAKSPLTGALDIKHDAVTVLPGYAMTLVPDNSAQTEAGAFVVYQHTISNSGGEHLNNIALTLLDSATIAGWSSALYQDSNLNGRLDSADSIISSLPSLAVAESVTLFVKVFAPSTALAGATNTTSITARFDAGTGRAATDLQVSVNDVTQIAQGDISIVKHQAPDIGCDIDADGAFGVDQFDIEPGNNCVIYRLTATNTGSTESYNVVIHDSTPNYTHYLPQAVCSASNCTLETPPSGGTGTLRASIPSLLPGASFSLEFAVRLD